MVGERSLRQPGEPAGDRRRLEARALSDPADRQGVGERCTVVATHCGNTGASAEQDGVIALLLAKRAEVGLERLDHSCGLVECSALDEHQHEAPAMP